MQTFRALRAALAAVPVFVPVLILPCCMLCAALVCRLMRRGRLYAPIAACLAAAGTALFSCTGSAEETLFLAACYALEGALLRCVRFVHLPKGKKGRGERRAAALYEKFARGAQLQSAPAAPVPPKVCCVEEEPSSLPPPEPGYALHLAERLQKEKLSATDRLETDVLCRTIRGLCGRQLSEGEARTLNDCLASVLRLTAKYKL